MELNPLVSFGLRAITLTAGVGNVWVNNVVVSRVFDAVTVLSVTADYGLQYLHHGNGANLAGLAIFGTSSVKACLVAAHPFDQKTRLGIAVGSFAVGTALSVASQLTLKHGFDPWTLLPIAGGAAGCGAVYAEDMALRRRFFLGVGATSAVFGGITGNWGMMWKNIIADIGSNVVAMIRDKDPLPSPRAGIKATRDFAGKLLHLRR